MSARRRTLEERAEETRPIREELAEHPNIQNVRGRAGGAMEFDPRKGEVMVPECIEFEIVHEGLSVLKHIDRVCEKHGLCVLKPDWKQPGFRWEGREYNRTIDYDTYVRLVDDR